MKYENGLNLFWMTVWAVVLICAIVGVFWKPAIYAVIVIGAVMFGMFLRDFIQVSKLR